MASQQIFRVPVWLPFLIIAVSVLAIVVCVNHMRKRVKARWPW